MSAAEIEVAAIDLARTVGRDWEDCCEYEREAFCDECRREQGQFGVGA